MREDSDAVDAYSSPPLFFFSPPIPSLRQPADCLAVFSPSPAIPSVNVTTEGMAGPPSPSLFSPFLPPPPFFSPMPAAAPT